MAMEMTSKIPQRPRALPPGQREVSLLLFDLCLTCTRIDRQPYLQCQLRDNMADLYSFRNAGSVSPSMSSWHRGGGRTNLNSRANFAPKVSQPRLESLGGDRKGILLASIDVNSIPLEDDSTKVSGPVVEDCNYIASYNWLDKKHATILVPGI